jgi:hypothetical protein
VSHLKTALEALRTSKRLDEREAALRESSSTAIETALSAAQAVVEASQGVQVSNHQKKPHYLAAQPYLALNRAVGIVDRGLDTLGTYLVGSCLERVDFRDVDVRTMMTDEAYDKLFPGGESGTESDAFWSLLCESIGAYLTQATGLPVDFQIQRMTEANALHPGPGGRNALSSAGGRQYPGELPSFVRRRQATESKDEK